MTPPRSARSADEQARLDAELVELFEHRITFNQTLGLKIESVRPGDVRATFPMRPELVGHYAYGRLHGGVISAVLDAMGGLAADGGHRRTPPARQRAAGDAPLCPPGHDRPARGLPAPGRGPAFRRHAPRCTRLGGRVGATQMRLVNDEGTLIATGAASYIIS